MKHYFPGGNTPEGFFSYYHQILIPGTAGKLAVIKGGPGCGKSTFMKDLGSRLEQQGKSICYLHCSSDPDSLDGILLPDTNTAVIDGTAPHIVDARYPGVCDRVLNFCDLIDEQAIVPQKDSVIETNEKIRSAFLEGYYYLKSAAVILEQMQTRSRAAYSEEAGLQFCLDTIKRLPKSSGEGSEQRMFLSAVTPYGCKNYLKETLQNHFVLMLRAQTGDAACDLLDQLAEQCRIRKIDIQRFMCPLNPRRTEHLVIPSANFAITVSNSYHSAEKPDEMVYFSDFCKEEYHNSKDMFLYDQLIKSAISKFAVAKTLHDRLEQSYIPYVNFEGIRQLIEPTLQFLTSY
ncbi:MAG: hypothetical protein J6A61_01450 [Clostridia bacterium]|nr:hypothetical protein [Clostridia bacterium]